VQSRIGIVSVAQGSRDCAFNARVDGERLIFGRRAPRHERAGST
jgi:hypothetical protein